MYSERVGGGDVGMVLVAKFLFPNFEAVLFRAGIDGVVGVTDEVVGTEEEIVLCIVGRGRWTRE
jgi:hypothetical protein